MSPDDLNRANLFLNHQRAKHSESCWNCDQPWPCIAVAALIDADHEWAQWFEKWKAALDLVGNASADRERLQSELAAATERAEKAHQVLERFADDLDSGPSTQLLATELRNRWREALRSTPAASNTLCGGCGRRYSSPVEDEQHGFGKCVPSAAPPEPKPLSRHRPECPANLFPRACTCPPCGEGHAHFEDVVNCPCSCHESAHQPGKDQA